MISATALNASTVPLNKSPQMPLGLDNSRLRVDSQKFLVPPLPVSSRQINPRPDPHNHPHHHNPHALHYQQQQHNGNTSSSLEGVNKRRPIHPISPVESGRIVAGISAVHNMNGIHRPHRSTSPLSGKGTSPNYAHMQSSPRKDAHSPMYAGEVPGFSGSPGANYSARSSVPIPCSSPSPGTSASPKSSVSHSLSPGGGNGGGGTSYPHLPPVLNPAANGANELSQLAVAAAAAAAASGNRLYSAGFPPPSAAAAHHAAFYAAAAAAAGHSLPYPSLFGAPYSSHQHAAAASSYLDFHSKLLRNSAAPELRSPSQSPPSRSYQAVSSPQQHSILQPLGSPQSTSVTSLHTKLIESVSATGDRFHPHHHTSHNHVHSGAGNQHSSRFSSSPSSSSVVNGISKGGPLGISGGIMGLSISPNSNSPHKGHSGPTATSATPEMSSKSVKLYMEHPGLPGNESSRERQERKLLAEMELLNGSKATKEAIMLAKQSMMTRSPEDFSINRHHTQEQQNPHKTAKSISFAADVHPGGIHRPPTHPSYINGHASHHPQQQHHLHSQIPQSHHHHPQHSTAHNNVPTNLSADCKKANSASNPTNNFPQQQHHLFLPPSPKKRSAHWNFAVPQSPNGGKVGDLLPPPPPPASDSLSNPSTPTNLHLSPSSKYLSPSHHNQKPSNGNNTDNDDQYNRLLNSKPLSHSHFHPSECQSRTSLIGSTNLKDYYFPFYKFPSPLCSSASITNTNSNTKPTSCVTHTSTALTSSSYPYPRHHQQLLHRFNSSYHHFFNPSSDHVSSGGPAAAMAGVNAGGVAAGTAAATGSHYQSTNAQQLLVVPNSPLSSSPSSHGGSGPSTPKSPSVHFRFFGGTNNKENNGVANNAAGRNGRILNARNDSSSSTSSVELGVINGNGRSRQNNGQCGPWPVEQMPLISAFQKGSMIKLASGELKTVEELSEDDFEKAVMMTDSVKIVYCQVIAIQTISDSTLCKVTLAMGAAQNQQVGIVPFLLYSS